MVKRTNKRQYIAIMPGDYQGTVYVPAAPGSLTLYGTGEKPIDVKIGMAIDGEMSVADWRRAVNPGGKYMLVNPPVYVRQLPKQTRRDDRCNVFCRVLVAE